VAGAVLVVLFLFLLFEDAEGFAGEIRSISIYALRINDMAKFVALRLIHKSSLKY
jgi:hypothetical protein